MQEDVGRDNDLHSTVANRIVELAKYDQKKPVTAGQSGVAVIAVRSTVSVVCRYSLTLSVIGDVVVNVSAPKQPFNAVGVDLV